MRSVEVEYFMGFEVLFLGVREGGVCFGGSRRGILRFCERVVIFS